MVKFQLDIVETEEGIEVHVAGQNSAATSLERMAAEVLKDHIDELKPKIDNMMNSGSPLQMLDRLRELFERVERGVPSNNSDNGAPQEEKQPVTH